MIYLMLVALENYIKFCNRLHLSLYYKIILCHDLKKHFYWKKNLQMISHIVKKNRIFMNKKRQVHSLNLKKNILIFFFNFL